MCCPGCEMGTEELEDHEDGGGECSAHCGAEEDERDEETSHHCIGRGIGGEAGADPNEHCWAEAVVNQRENVGAFDGEIIAIGACHCSTFDQKLDLFSCHKKVGRATTYHARIARAVSDGTHTCVDSKDLSTIGKQHHPIRNRHGRSAISHAIRF